MKNLLLFIFFTAGTMHFLYGQNKNTTNKNIQLKAFLDSKSFYAPEMGNYTEIHLQFLGYTLKYKPVNERDLQGEVAVQLILRSGDKVVASDAYRLQSPIMKDSIVEDFYDIKRFPVAPGIYELELSLQDLVANGQLVTGKQMIEVADLSSKPSLSNIQVAEAMRKTTEETMFTKSGYEIIPRISNYFSGDASFLPVYLEVYNAGKNGTFGLKQSIKESKSGTEIEGYTRMTRLEVNQIQPIIRNIDLERLPSGEYQLEFELLSKENTVLGKSTYYFENLNDRVEEISLANMVLDPDFQKLVSDDSLKYYVASLIPISGSAEAKNILKILKTKDNDQYRKYLQAFWIRTSQQEKPYDAFLKYKYQVQLVEKKFGTNFIKGFETDRGRVYLQYGAPSSIVSRESSPSDYPYEMWYYDKIDRYSNKRFIFYNPDLVNNVYRLLHSDMIGEIQNYRWQQQLAKRNSANSNIDDPNDGNVDHWGGNSSIYYNQH